jgi:hypothetical protein
MRGRSRTSHLALVLVALTACGQSRAAADVPAATEPSPSPAATGKVPPLFVYAEGGDTLSFWRPRTVRLVLRAAGDVRVCQTELDDNGNMWTGRDVEAAFGAAEVQTALRTTRAPFSADVAATLTAAARTITWAIACDKCLPQTAGVKHLLTVLDSVMRNRRALCP